MKIPESLKVGGMLIKIFYPAEQVIFKDEKGEDAQADGKILISTGEMHIANKNIKENNTYTEDYIGQVFMHEILHAIDYVYNSDRLPEEEIERLSQGLYQVLKDNQIIVGKVDAKVDE
ncbi:MAG: hypothetical protein NTY95_17620 [Bacteroidia bacterium]|nr:hypothetical protein [Bacteroidia bacterium]